MGNERNPSAQQDRPFGDGFVLAGQKTGARPRRITCQSKPVSNRKL